MHDPTHIAGSDDKKKLPVAALLAMLCLVFAVGITVGVFGHRFFHSCESSIPESPPPPIAFPEIPERQPSPQGFVLKDVNMNDLMGFLAKKAGMQYFHNAVLDDPKYRVSGHLNEGNEPKTQIDSIARGFGLSVQTKDGTLHVLTPEQSVRWDKNPSE